MKNPENDHGLIRDPEIEDKPRPIEARRPAPQVGTRTEAALKRIAGYGGEHIPEETRAPRRCDRIVDREAEDKSIDVAPRRRT